MNNKQIGNFIACLRREKGMTQRELADRLNITDKAVSKWETGEGYPEISIIPALAEVLGVSIDELFKGERGRPDDCSARDQQTGAARGEYLLDAAWVKFKNMFPLSLSLAFLGLIAFFTITLSSYYEIIGYGVQAALVLAGALLFAIAYISIKDAVDKYGKLFPGGNQVVHRADYADRALIISLWVKILTLTGTLPYILLDSGLYTRSIITFQTYLSFLPLFLVGGSLLAWIVASLVRIKLKLPGETKGERLSSRKIYLFSIGSDVYLVLLLFIPGMIYSDPLRIAVVLTGLAGYVTLTILAVKNRGEISRGAMIAIIARNILVGFTMIIIINSTAYWYLIDDRLVLNLDGGRFSTYLGLLFALAIFLTYLIGLFEQKLYGHVAKGQV